MSGFPASSTYGSLADEIIAGLQGFTATPDRMSVLTAAVGPTDTSLKVEDATVFALGVIEVGDELIYIKSADTTAGQVNTNPAWRGHLGTQAASHAAGDSVTYRPRFPRSVVKREINNVLLSVYPTVFGVRKLEVAAQQSSPHYELPAEARHILKVQLKTSDLEGWRTVNTWSVDHAAPSEFGTGVTLNLYGLIDMSATLQIAYAVEPTVLVNESDGFAAVTGLPERAKDIVVLGVQSRLYQALDLARLPNVSAEADANSQGKPLGSAMSIGQQLAKQYQDALTRERSELKSLYPTQLHKVL